MLNNGKIKRLFCCFRLHSTSKMRHLIYCFVLIGTIGATRSPIKSTSTVNRINYGVLFKLKGRIYPVTGVWHHSFFVNLARWERLFVAPHINANQLTSVAAFPSPPSTNNASIFSQNINEIGVVANDTQSTTTIAPSRRRGGPPLRCHHWSDNLKFLQKVYKQGHARLSRLLEAIHTLVPQNDQQTSKRSLLPFVGTIFKGSFGVSTVADTQKLEGHVLAMERLQDSQTKAMKTTVEHMSSFLGTSVKRIDVLSEIVRMNTLNSVRLLEETSTKILQQVKFCSNISLYTMELQQAFSELEYEYQSTWEGLQSTIAGTLSPYLVTKDVLSRTLASINETLVTSGTNLRLVNDNPHAYYSGASYICTVREGVLIVTMKIPLTSFQEKLAIYEIKTFPSVLHDNSGHVTMLQDAPIAVAIHDEADYYYTLTEKDLRDVELHHLSHEVRVFRSTHRPSCINGYIQ